MCHRYWHAFTILLFLNHLEGRIQWRFICYMPTTIDRFKWFLSIIVFTADFLLCDVTWYIQARRKMPNLIYLFFFFSGMLSSVMFYYLSWFLIVLIHFIVHGVLLFIFSLFLILTQRKKVVVVICILYQKHSANSNGFLRQLCIFCFSESLLYVTLTLKKIP